ncbi:MAG: PAS domain-containing protein, partial [Bdellovibrionales bacterium]|nr:PAS domain-containing protein [Ramlibacter sp.]
MDRISNPQESLAFLGGTSAMARAMREADWAASPLGPPQEWPQSLRSVVNLVLGSAFPMFVSWGPQLVTLYNDGYAVLCGEKHPAGLGQPILEIWSELRTDLEPLIARALAGESFFVENLLLRMRRHGFDEDTWFTFSYSPLVGEDGQIAGLYCTCIETTQSVRTQQQLRAREEWLQSLFHQAPGFAAVLRGPDHRFEMANQAYSVLTGNRPLVGMTVAQAMPEAMEQGFGRWLDKVYATGEAFVGRSVPVTVNQGEGKAPYETIIDFLYQPLRDAQGQVEGIFIQGHEVTEQHRAQQVLQAFSDSIPAIAWVAAPDGGLERFNAQWQDYTGQSAQLALGHGWVSAVHPDDLPKARAAWEAARGGNQAWQAEYRLRRQDGVYRWFLARVVPQLDESGRLLRWFGTTTDIDDARHATQTLRQADQQKDEFLATLAHELRNPLAPIRTAVHLLGRPNADEQTRSRAAEVIGRQVGYMARLLDDLIDVARITQRKLVLKKERVQVGSIVDAVLEAARPLADAKQHLLSAVLQDSKAEVLADPIRMAQVLINLLNNAVKYTDPGGSIQLAVRRESNELCLTVMDNGIGLTPLALEHVFAMFAQEQTAIERSEGGLGIGLALAKGLVQLHGGSLSAHSAGVGQGSSFVVRLPLDDGQEPPATACHGHNAAQVPARKVLLADDNRDSAETLADLLRSYGHDVHTAHDGAKAAELAMQLQPDVLILDIGMPGMTGYEVARHVRAQSWG